MAKQIVEKHFRESVITRSKVFISKIQVNPHSFTPTEGDFFIQTSRNDIIVECKQVSGNRSFYIDRLTQEKKLLDFEKRFNRNKAYIFLCYWKGSKKNSYAFLIPILSWIKFRKQFNMKNLNLETCENVFSCYQVDIFGKIWQINI